MQIILQEDVEKLGNRGDVVTVKPGYARNFLLPNKLAVEATPGNMKVLERIRAALAKRPPPNSSPRKSRPSCSMASP
jgi:large subunit ribosomal protein L9